LPITFIKTYRTRLLSSSTVKTISALLGANAFASVLGVIGSFIQARVIAPEELGYFRGFSIATGYIFFLHLGLFTLLERSYPYYVGKGDKAGALALAQICRSWNMIVSFVASGSFVILAMVSLADGNWKAMLGWVVQSVVIASYFYGGYLSTVCRSAHQFSVLARSAVYSSLINAFMIPLYFIWPYITMALRGALGSLVGLGYIHKHCPIRVAWRFNWGEWLELTKKGMLLFVASYGAGIGWETAEKSIVLMCIGTTALGLWSFSFMLLMMMRIVPESVTAVYVPRITETFGRTGSVRESMMCCYRPMVLGVPATLLVVGAMSMVVHFMVPILLPKYTYAVPAICVMMLRLPLLVLNLPHAVLVAIGNSLHLNIITYASLTSFLLCAFVATGLGFGLNGVIISSLLGRIVRIGLVFCFLSFHRLREL